MKAYHYVARVRAPEAPFWDRNKALWMWRRLRQEFPVVLSCTIMPNHLHILIPEKPDEAVRLSYIIRAFSQAQGLGRDAWEPVPPPKIIIGTIKLLYEIRYIILNPNRKSYVDDSLKWEFTIHRDLVGARVDPWCTFEEIRKWLGRYAGPDLAEFQRRMSVDLLAKPGGLPLPDPGHQVKIPHKPLADVLKAVILAAGAPSDPRSFTPWQRTLFAKLAYDQGWRGKNILAPILDVTPMTIWRDRNTKIPENWVQAGRKVLWNPRLLTPLRDWVHKDVRSG